MAQEHSELVERNLQVGRAFFAAQDRLRGGPDAALCAPSYRAVIGGHPPMPREGHEAFAQAFYAGLPDGRHEIADVFATSDRVAVRFVIHGSHTAPLFGIPPTGRAVTVAGHVLMRIDADGRVDELLGIFDEAGLLRQLGVLPG
jgi:predicted ester cyclase